MRFPEDFVRAVRDAADIESVASDHSHLKKMSGRLFGICPLHQEKTPSFSVDPRTGLFYCFGCQRGGDAILLHMLATGDDFAEALEALALRYGIPIPATSDDAPARAARSVLERAQAFFRRSLDGSPSVMAYALGRGLTGEQVAAYGIGYAPKGWRSLSQGIDASPADLEAAGLCSTPQGGGRPYDRFRDRLMFPIRDAAGRIVGFSGRTLGDEPPKYLNSPESAAFKKGAHLFGLAECKREAREAGIIALCEGQLDALAAARCGVPAVASMGTALTPAQCAQLRRLGAAVVLCFDPDGAGEGAAGKALPGLLRLGLAVRRAELPPGEDLASLALLRPSEPRRIIEGAPDAVERAIARATPSGACSAHERAAALRSVREILSRVQDEALRYHYARGAAPRLAVQPEMIFAATVSAAAPPLAAPAGTAEEAALAAVVAAPPPLDALPPAEIFREPRCLAAYSAFLRLYSSAGVPPSPLALIAALPPASEAAQAIARPCDHGDGDPRPALRALEARWARARVAELAAEISRARPEDVPALLAAKSAASKILHKRY